MELSKILFNKLLFSIKKRNELIYLLFNKLFMD